MNLVEYALAGNATFTVQNERTGKHFTYKVRATKEGNAHFVSVLRGQNNEDDYSFLGTIFGAASYRHGRKSHIDAGAQSAVVFNWLWPKLLTAKLPESVKFIPSERCCVCGRKLTNPASCADFIGPECRKRRS
jgi:hypothetical protein